MNIKILGLAVTIFVLILATNAYAAWTIYEQLEEGSDFKKTRTVTEMPQTEQMFTSYIKGLCIVRLWGGSYAVKIINDKTAEEKMFICDEVNEKKPAEEEKSEPQKRKEQIKLW